MSINVKLLADICEIAGAPGFEYRIRNLVKEQLKDVADEMYTDNMGNLICVKKGKSSEKRVMTAGHMDEIGFIVTHIDDDGFVRFHVLGGFDPKTLTAQRVIVHGTKDVIGVMGSKPIHVMSAEERTKMPKTTDFFIDMGMPKAEVEKYISVGDSITRQRDLIEMGNCVNCKSIDNRVAVFIQVEAMKELKNVEIPYDFYCVFTVQEEVGIRGAVVAAHHINPDFGIALDTTIAFDVPGSPKHEQITRLGDGTAIKLMDSASICDYRMVAFMKDVAKRHNIKHQFEILTAGGTDTAGMQRMATNGVIAGAISIPTRHIHQSIEMADKTDIRLSIDLFKACIEDLDKHDWSHK